MQKFAVLALAATAMAAPQGVTSDILPSASASAVCQPDYSGTLELTVVNITSTQKVKRETLVVNLQGGILKDGHARTGYIASNNQFQFDHPPQPDALNTAGFRLCPNGSLTLADSATFWRCNSGSFYNLYDKKVAPQCSPIFLQVMEISPSAVAQAPHTTTGNGTQVSQIGDGQPQTTTVTQINDGQLHDQAASQIPDGQVQVSSSGGTSQSPPSGNASTTPPTEAPAMQTVNAAVSLRAEAGAFIASLAAVLALL